MPVRIAVASDAAFCFVYEDNLRLLREAGAEIVTFSPLNERSLPPAVSGVYLPGGYPELFAERLAANTGMIRDIRSAAERDMPMYAECGGFIYLTQGMAGPDGTPLADFSGLFPVRTRMLPKRKALGYRQVNYAADTFMAAADESARGHEFHYSEIGEMSDDIDRCYRVTRQGLDLGTEGYRIRNCLASYIHLHFGSNPTLLQLLSPPAGSTHHADLEVVLHLAFKVIEPAQHRSHPNLVQLSKLCYKITLIASSCREAGVNPALPRNCKGGPLSL